uniref:Zn(2)-C6 fungal-type domain-containing protein n=1 Tax=Bionectria ochroleuca TaxID=29856 RepID=A0A8H7KCA8_BIOOC
MPGVPKTQGCQTCKLRKIKCDETWPACANCRKSKLLCPGPTQLLKFLSFEAPGKKKTRATASNEHGAASVWRSLQRRGARGAADAGGEQGMVVIPRPISPTEGDRSVSRLVAHLETGLKKIGCLNLSFATHLPKRLAESTCLRDSVDFFCRALVDFQNPYPQGAVLAFPQYGKALKSLRMALVGGEALKAETLAAVAIIERSSSLLDRWGRTGNIHFKAALQIMRQRGSMGRMDANDELDVALCRDLHQQAMFGWTVKENDESQEVVPWEEAFARVAKAQEKASLMQPLALEDLAALSGCCIHLNARVSQFQSWLREPDSKNKLKFTYWNKDLSEMEKTMTQLSNRLAQGGLKQGHMVILPMDAEHFLETRYHFSWPLLCLLYMVQLFTQLVALTVMQETHTILHGEASKTLHARLREAALEVWKCGPYLQSLDPMIGPFPTAPIFATYEIANPKEKEYVLDLVRYLDKYWGNLPRNREEQRLYLSKMALALTGRDPDTPYF